MSDLDKMKMIFDEIKVDYTIITAKEERGVDVDTIEYGEGVVWDTKINLYEGMGYPSFFCDFYFLNGKYQKYGVWE